MSQEHAAAFGTTGRPAAERDPLCPISSIASHPGTVRASNEDSFLSRPEIGLWMVADGTGGHSGGAIASGAIADALNMIPSDLPRRDVLDEALRVLDETHRALRKNAAGTSPTATTVVMLVLCGDKATLVWIGDSRGYRLRKNALSLLTRDHSLVQEMIGAGLVTVEEARNHPARNIITRALGANSETPQIEIIAEQAEPGDVYLLCSDGLSGPLSNDDIATLLSGPFESSAESLVAAALARDGRDNITALVVSTAEGPQQGAVA